VLAIPRHLTPPIAAIRSRDSTATLPIGVETHIAATYNANEVGIYINGALDSVATAVAAGRIEPGLPDPQHVPNEALGIGDQSVRNRPFKGLIDEVALVDRALCADRSHGQGGHHGHRPRAAARGTQTDSLRRRCALVNGKELLKDALTRIAQAADTVGARAVLVHATDEQAKKFYQILILSLRPSTNCSWCC